MEVKNDTSKNLYDIYPEAFEYLSKFSGRHFRFQRPKTDGGIF